MEKGRHTDRNPASPAPGGTAASGVPRRRLAAVLVGVAAASVVAVGPAAAAPSDVVEFDLVLPSTNCGPAEINNYLHFTRSVKPLPDGTEHYFLHIRGTVVNEDNGREVRVHAVRRFTDDPLTDTTSLSGLQVQLSAAGAGMLHLNAGTMDTGISDPFAITEQHGRWDGLFAGAELPAALCSYLVG